VAGLRQQLRRLSVSVGVGVDADHRGTGRGEAQHARPSHATSRAGITQTRPSRRLSVGEDMAVSVDQT